MSVDKQSVIHPTAPSSLSRRRIRIASAKETLTVGAADCTMAKILSIEEGAPVVTIERTALGYDRSPLEYRLSRAAAEGFRYPIDIS